MNRRVIVAVLALCGATLAAPATGSHDRPWPAGLEGPFARLAPERVRVRSFDGVELDGWIQRPALPAGVRAPVVLVSSPYFGQTAATADTDEEVLPRFLVDHGYAVAGFNVRGTGNSGGCFEFFGPREQRDQAVLVEWLAARPWSNGRVGMYGLSYMGTTPWEAAIQNPPHLRTIVVAGMVADAYHFFFSPQGAPFTIGGPFATAVTGVVSGAPPLLGSPANATVDHVPVLPGRVCQEVADLNRHANADTFGDERAAAFWRARRLAARFDKVRAAVFVTHGFQDLWTSGHAYQEDYVWHAVRAPKRMLEGQWGHEFPPLATWNDTLREWLDHWLKGIGPAAPGAGRVDYEDTAGTWRATTAWPPRAGREALYLAGDGLARAPGGAPRSFVGAPLVVSAENGRPPELLCPPSGSLVYASPPVSAPVHVAGNPFAYLRLTADRPGGLVAAHLVDLAPGFGCTGGVPTGYTFLTSGSADLRFHTGGFTAKPFPTGAETAVRVDLASVAHTLRPGHRLALVLSGGDAIDRTSRPYAPLVEVGNASHVVLPLVSGTLGGADPLAHYPPNPMPRSW